MKLYRLSEDAKMDLARIYWRGHREFGEVQADKYYQACFDRFEALAEAPLNYQAVDYIRQGYRRSVCGADSIYYRVNDDVVEIMRVLGRQNPEDSVL